MKRTIGLMILFTATWAASATAADMKAVLDFGSIFLAQDSSSNLLLQVQSGGNVGIGAGAPGAKFSVAGQAAIGSTSSHGFDLYVAASNATAFIDAVATPGTAALFL